MSAARTSKAARPVKPRKRAARVAPALRRELLLQAAITCLSEEGLRGFTLQNVAQRANVSLALIGHYFGGIEELLQAVFAAVMFKMPAAPKAEPRSLEEATTQLMHTVESTFAPDYYSRDNLLVWLPLYEEMYLKGRIGRRLVAQEEQYIKAVARQIDAVARFRRLKVDAQQIAADFIALADGLWLHWCFTDSDDYSRNRETAVRYLELHIGTLRGA